MLLLMTSVTSCSPSADSIAEKIKKHATLTDADYKKMCSYLTDCADDLADAMDDDDVSAKDLLNLEKKYKYADIFLEELMKNPDKMDAETAVNVAVIQELCSDNDDFDW